jgi:hypothetical protein
LRGIDKALRQSGFNSLSDLVNQEIKYRGQVSDLQTRANANLQSTQDARQAANSKLNSLMGGFVAPSQEDLNKAAADQTNIINSQIDRSLNDQTNTLFERMNAANVNPAAYAGRLGEWAAQSKLEAPTQGLARALALLSGEQSLQSNAASGLQGLLGYGNSLAQNAVNTQMGLGQIASNQALNLAGLNAQTNSANANLLAGGISAGVNSLSQIPLLYQLLSKLPGGQKAAPFDPGYGYDPSAAGLGR